MVDNYFQFDEVDPTQPTEIGFFLQREGGDTLLGKKRFVGRQTIQTSPASYLQRLLSPEPHHEHICKFIYPAGRNLKAYLRWGSEFGHISATVPYTAANHNLTAPAILGADFNRRSIARGECDEVLFLVDEQTQMGMNILLPNGQVVGLNQNSGSHSGLWVLCVDIEWVLSRIANPDSIKEFELQLKIDGDSVATIHYDIVTHPLSAIRLAWLTPDGSIGYHTFEGVAEESTEVECSEVESLVDGNIVVGMRGRQQLKIRSGLLPNDTFLHLCSLVTSPMVWRIEADGGFSRVAIITAKATKGRKQINDLEVVIAPQSKHLYW